MKQLTEQQIFNRASTHLLKQRKKASVRGDGGYDECQYRSPGGLKCAIGCFIPDRVYQSSIEGQGIDTLARGAVLVTIGLAGVSTDFLEDLQSVHDTSPPRGWPKRLKAFAEKYNLSTRWMP